LKTRFAQTVQTPVSIVSAVFGCVKWLKTSATITFGQDKEENKKNKFLIFNSEFSLQISL